MAVLPEGERGALDDLLEALASAFAAEGRAGGDAAAAALQRARTQPYRRIRDMSDVRSVLEAACAHPDALPVAALIWACRDLISWQAWKGEGLAAALSARLHFTELVGPDGHIFGKGVRVGLLVSEAETDYPISRHAGEETYLVISGVAAWSAGGAPYTPQAPGTLVHHPAWAPHGRRTLHEPFLGAWRWSGDLDLTRFKVDA